MDKIITKLLALHSILKLSQNLDNELFDEFQKLHDRGMNDISDLELSELDVDIDILGKKVVQKLISSVVKEISVIKKITVIEPKYFKLEGFPSVCLN